MIPVVFASAIMIWSYGLGSYFGSAKQVTMRCSDRSVHVNFRDLVVLRSNSILTCLRSASQLDQRLSERWE